MGIEIEQTKYDQVPTGGYPAVIDTLDMVEGQFGEQVRWTFRIVQPGTDWDGIVIRGWTSAKFSPKSKLYGWTRAVLGGREIPADYTWNSDHLLGHKCTIVVVEKVKPDGKEFSKIEDVRPAKAINAPAPLPVPAAEPDENYPF